MRKFVWLLIALSLLSFITAFVSALFSIDFFGVASEGYSNACTNLALIAIAFMLVLKKKD
jgi:hypothetical protein